MLSKFSRTLGVGVAVSLPAVAVALTLPNTFSNGDVLSASGINANFDALRVEIEALQAEVESLKARPTSEVGETIVLDQIPVMTSRQYEIVADGILMSRPGGPGNIPGVRTSLRICTTAGLASCMVGPRAYAGGESLTLPVRAGDFIDFEVTGGEDGDAVQIFWTPLTAEATGAPVVVE